MKNNNNKSFKELQGLFIIKTVTYTAEKVTVLRGLNLVQMRSFSDVLYCTKDL